MGEQIKLQVRDLRTGKLSQESFASEALAVAWLRVRPKHSEVIGIAMASIDGELNARLKAACRPLDGEEQLQKTQVNAAVDAARRQQLAEQQQREQAALEQHRLDMADADPARPMEIRYRFDRGLSLIDPADSRTITDEARQAIEAWVAERHAWLAGRQQVIGDAILTVWPAALPTGASARVVSGSFTPVAAPVDDEDDC